MLESIVIAVVLAIAGGYIIVGLVHWYDRWEIDRRIAKREQESQKKQQSGPSPSSSEVLDHLY